jgi:DNA-binding transcriptional regulator GbsR (MarR family)
MYDNNIQTWKYDYHMPENHKSNNEVTDLDIQNFYNYLFQNRKYVIYKNIEDDAMKYLKISKKKVSSIVTKLHEFGLIKKDGNNYYQNIPF